MTNKAISQIDQKSSVDDTDRLLGVDPVAGNTVTWTWETLLTRIQAALSDSAPALLDTFNELASALGDDPNFAATIANDISNLDSALTAAITSLSDDITTEANRIANKKGYTLFGVDDLNDLPHEIRFGGWNGTEVPDNAPWSGTATTRGLYLHIPASNIGAGGLQLVTDRDGGPLWYRMGSSATSWFDWKELQNASDLQSLFDAKANLAGNPQFTGVPTIISTTPQLQLRTTSSNGLTQIFKSGTTQIFRSLSGSDNSPQGFLFDGGYTQAPSSFKVVGNDGLNKDILHEGNLDNFVSLTKSYESGEQVWVVDVQETFPHGLGQIPKIIDARLKMTTAAHGFANDHEVQINTGQFGAAIWADATNVYVQSGSTSGIYQAIPGGTWAYVTPAQANLIVKAYA